MYRFNLNKYLMLVVMTCSCVVASAQQHAKILGSDGNPIPFATVSWENGSGQIADESGNVMLAKEILGRKLKVSAMGYRPEWFIISPADTVFRLTEAAHNMETFVVTGNFEPQSARNSVYQVRAITRETIENRAPISVQEILNTQLGIRFNQDNALGSSNLELLGMSGQNVKILIDGVPMVGRQGTSNEININQIDINQIERVEIVEGPMSVVYGADALAGVINIITKSSQKDKLALTARLQEETVGSEYSPLTGKGNHTRSISGTYGYQSWTFGAGLTQNRFGGWKGDFSGRQYQWLPRDQDFLNFKTGWSAQSVSLDYQLDWLNETVYSYGAEAPLEVLDQEFITHRFMHRLNGQWDKSPRFSMNWQGGFTDFSRDTETWVNNTRTGERYLSRASGSQSSIGYTGLSWRMIAKLTLHENFNLQPGIDINIENGSGERITENHGIQDYALFLSGEWTPSPTIQLRPGLRKSYNSAYQAPGLIPSLNTKFGLSTTLDLRLAYARGFRAPSIRELHFDFFDASHSIQGNPDLQAETSHSFNGSLDWNPQPDAALKTGTTVGFFYNEVRDRIVYGQDPDDIRITTLFNLEKYRTTGVTWNQSVRIHNWDGNAGFSYIGRFNQFSQESEGLPQMLWTPEINANLTYTVAPWNTSINLFYKWTGALPGYESTADAQGNITHGEILLDGFHWADLTLKKRFGKSLTLNLGARNLFDITQINSTAQGEGAHGNGAARPIGYGRSYFLGIQYQINP